MSEETETGTQTLDSSSETIELRLRQEVEMEPISDETTIDKLTLRSDDERIKQATDPILGLEELCSFLARRTDSEASVRAAIMGPSVAHATGTTRTSPTNKPRRRN